MSAQPRSRAHGHDLLVEHLRRAGGEPAAHLDDARQPDLGRDDGPGPAQWAAAGPRAAADPDRYELALELVHEGYLLHYAQPLVLHPPDADLALLLGDRLYAEGLAVLTELGDLEAIAELADVIALSAQAHAAGDAGLAQAAWLACGTAVGFGADAEHVAAKAAARAGEGDAEHRLRAAARQAAGYLAPMG